MKKGNPYNCFLGLDILSSKEEELVGCNVESLNGKGVNPYDIIREKILAAIDTQGLKWVKSWAVARLVKPMNYKTKSNYSGINLIFLGSVLEKYNTSNPFFLSYKQAADIGGQVKEGSKGIPIFYWSSEGKSKETKKVKVNTSTGKPIKNFDTVDESNTTEVEERIKFSFLKYYTVFHANDIEGIDWKYDAPKQFEASEGAIIESAESIIDGMPMPPKMVFENSDRAFYSPSKDTVNMPKIGQFRSEQEYYGTFFHELVHSTAHGTRLGRVLGGRFGDKKYAFEELIAEVGAAFLCGEAGILNFTFENSAAYIQGWHKSLKKNIYDDKNFIIKAAKKAEEAADYMLNKKKEASKTKESTESIAPAVSSDTVKIEENKAKNGIEVKFKTKPDPEYIKVLKELGFKWSPKNGLWYAPFSKQKLEAARKRLLISTSQQLTLTYDRLNGIGKGSNKKSFNEFINEFIEMNEKEVKTKDILLLIKNIQSEIRTAPVDKNSQTGLCIMAVQKKLAKAYNYALDEEVTSLKIKINTKDLSWYKKTIEQISGLGDLPTQPLPKALHKNNAPDFLTIDEFGFIRADKAAVTDKTNMLLLPGEIGKLLQHINRHRYAIALTGPKGGGKTQVIMQLANAFAQAGEEVAIFSLEQGGLESSDTIAARDRNIDPKNFSKISITGQANEGIDTIKKLASTGKFTVIIIDSWQKLKIVSTRFDELRQEFPTIIWIVVFQQNAEGGTRGGVAAEYEANVVLVIHKVDKSFLNNWVELDKNRGNELNRHYIISEKKTYEGFCPEVKEVTTNKEEGI